MTKELSLLLFITLAAGMFYALRWVFLKAMWNATDVLSERVIKDYGYLSLVVFVLLFPLVVFVPGAIMKWLGV